MTTSCDLLVEKFAFIKNNFLNFKNTPISPEYIASFVIGT
jgi:hypothetical protein